MAASREHLPNLTPDIWSNVARHLTPTDLHALGQTCHTLYRVVTSEYQFHQRVQSFNNERRIAPWSLQFRRFCGIHCVPEQLWYVGLLDYTNKGTTQNTVIIGCVSDSIVLYDEQQGRIVGFPQGWTRYIGPHMAERCIMVGGGAIAIIHGSDSRVTSLERLNACNGERLNVAPVQDGLVSTCAQFTKGRLRRPQVAMSGGVHGDHCVFARSGLVSVLSLADGSLTQQWDLSREESVFGCFVRGEDGGWYSGEGDRGMRVIGYMKRRCRIRGNHRTWAYYVTDLVDDSVRIQFISRMDEDVIDVVASFDYQWIGRRVVRERRAIIWLSKRDNNESDIDESNDDEPDDDEWDANYKKNNQWAHWYHDVGKRGGMFANASCEFVMGRGGREARVLPFCVNRIGNAQCDGRMVRIWNGCDDDVRVDSVKGVKRVMGCAFDWATITGDGRMLIASCRRLGLVSFFELESGRCIRSFQWTESLREICLVGDHWLVAITSSGCLCEAHFGCWCRQSEDAQDGVTTQCQAAPVTDQRLGRFGICKPLFGRFTEVWRKPH